MAVDEYARFENVKSSLEVYLNTQLSAESPAITIDFEGMDFDDASVDEWVQSRIIGIPQKQYARQLSSSRSGNFTRALWQVSCFVRKAKTTNINRHHEIRDILASHLPVGKTIDWRDHGNGNTQSLGSLQVHEIDTDRTLGEEDGIIGWAYAVLIEYLESFPTAS